MIMGDICILTDSSVQFPRTAFPGKENVRVLPLMFSSSQGNFTRENPLNLTNLPLSANQITNPFLIPPTQLNLEILFENLLQEFNEIVAIFLTNQVYPLVAFAQKIAQASPARSRIHIYDSRSISSGLGDVVENAARITKENGSSLEIAQMIRESIPKIYSMLFVPSPTYLAKAGIIELPQAIISEYLEIFPIYSLEEGKMLPVQKVKTHRGVFDIFQEFLEEFEELKLVTLTQGGGISMLEERMFRQYCKERFKHSNFLEMPLSQSMAVLFGPRSMGLVAIEK
jgi:DegV family protein with EDD domain